MAKTEFYIYRALKEHSDKDHPLSQAQILDILVNEYGFPIERKAIKRNLADMIERGYRINYTETTRETKNGKQPLMTDFYLERDFSDEELKMLIDSVLFSQHIPKAETKDITKKLRELGSVEFQRKIGNIEKISSQFYHTTNERVFESLEQINKALKNEKMISFVYGEYWSDKKLHPVNEEPIVSYPLFTVTVEGFYYVLCRKEGKIESYRIDRIMQIETLKYGEKTVNYEFFDVGKYITEHQAMYVGEPILATMKVDRDYLSLVIDHFGTDFKVLKENPEDDTLEIRIRSNENDLYYWALQNGDVVEVVSPQSMRNRLRYSARMISNKYLATDADEYGKSIDGAKSRMKCLYLRLECIGKRTEHKKFTDLRHIELVGHTKEIVHDLSFVRNNKQLRVLRISGTPIRDTSIFEGLNRVVRLTLRNVEIDDLSFLGNMPYLTELWLDRINGDVDYSVLLKLKNLRKLNLYCNLNEEYIKELQEKMPDVKIAC